jgi:hypothetical protein
MHIGLIDRPFVPHNLITAQERPVPLPKFQMAPRLKIQMSCGSKTGTQIYYPVLLKSLGKRIPSRFPNGAPMERDTCLQGIFTSRLTYLFISKALQKQCPSMSSKSGAPTETDTHSRALLNISFEVPSKEAFPSRSPSWSPLRGRCPIPSYLLHSSFEVPGIQAPSPDSRFPSDVKGPLWREMPISEAFLNTSSRVPTNGALPGGPPH